MKVRVKLTRWSTGYVTQGAAVRKPEPETGYEAARWMNPPRYELKAGGSVERAEKVVPIRDQPTALKADVLPIRPARIQAGNDEDLTPAEMVQGLSHVLNPASTVLLALGLWRLGSDLGLTSAFVITDGPFSHWQVWIAAAGGLQAIGLALRKRFAASPERSSALD